MRASRLLRILLLLQNRGRMTSAALAEELECATRTILRDVDAMTEAGLPVIVHRGPRGGIELGFNYRSRLTGLDADEAEALGILLATPNPVTAALGLDGPARRAGAKLIESLPDRTRAQVEAGALRFRARPDPAPAPDPRLAALAEAIRGRRVVRLRARSRAPLTVFPERLELAASGWSLHDARATQAPVPMREWGDLNISARTFP